MVDPYRSPEDTCRIVVLQSRQHVRLICKNAIDFDRFTLKRAYLKLYVTKFIEINKKN